MPWGQPDSLEGWEAAYWAVITEYEEEIAALEAEREAVRKDAQTLGEVVGNYQRLQSEWKAIERRFERQNQQLSESLEDREKRLALASDELARMGFQLTTSGKWVKVR